MFVRRLYALIILMNALKRKIVTKGYNGGGQWPMTCAIDSLREARRGLWHPLLQEQGLS